MSEKKQEKEKEKENKEKDKDVKEEDFDSDEDERDEKDIKTSRMDKMKKWGASKIMNLKAGRSAVLGFIGPEGNAILDNVKSIMVKDLGKAEGKEMKKDVLKIASKIKIMVDSKKLTVENTKDAQAPTLRLAEQLLDYLEPGSTKTAEDVAKLKGELKESMQKTYTILFELIKPHMQEKNAAKLTKLYDYVRSDEFLTKIRKESKFQDERRVIYTNLETLLSTVQTTVNPELPCQVSGCDKKRVGAQGNFPGSEFCAMHHYKKFAPQIESPSFAYWMKEESLRSVMMGWLQREGLVENVSFSTAVDQYKQITRAQMRSSRGPLIFSKFLEAKSVRVDEKIVDSIKQQMETSKDSLSKQLFNDAQTEVLSRMQTLFETKFISTKEFSTWAQKVTLPEAIHKEMHDQYSKVKEADLNLKKAHAEKEAARLHQQMKDSKDSKDQKSK